MKHARITPEVRRKMKQIQIYTRRLLTSALVGDSRSAIRGSGFEFDQIREYRQGDDIRFIDWNASARTNSLLVKEYIEERSRTILLCVDISNSVLFGSHDASKRDVVLISDEIYRQFCYDEPFHSPAEYNPQTLVCDGFSKSAGMPGWRLGFAHGPSRVIREMIKLQQYSFVCAPHPFQWAGATAMDADTREHLQAYRRKRDLIADGLADLYELVRPTGAFYAFPKAPWGTGTEFVEKAITEHKLLIIPGQAFSRRDTHFRISFAAPDEVIDEGVAILRKMAAEGR